MICYKVSGTLGRAYKTLMHIYKINHWTVGFRARLW